MRRTSLAAVTAAAAVTLAGGGTAALAAFPSAHDAQVPSVSAAGATGSAKESTAASSAKKLTGRQLLANAIRKSIAAHTVGYHYNIDAKVSGHPLGFYHRHNPIMTIGGVADFRRHMATAYVSLMPHSGLNFPTAQAILERDVMWFGMDSSVIHGGAWDKTSLAHSDDVNGLLRVMKGRDSQVTVVSRRATLRDGSSRLTLVHFTAKSNADAVSGADAKTAQFADAASGHATQVDAWIDSDGRLARVRESLKITPYTFPGTHMTLRAVSVDLVIGGYGMKLVLPRHQEGVLPWGVPTDAGSRQLVTSTGRA